MIRNLKISTALLLSTVFLFRILFVNLGILSSLSSHQNHHAKKTHFSNSIKRRKAFEALNNSKACEYSAIEICDEDSKDSDQFKSTPFVLIRALYFQLTGKPENNVKPFYNYLSYTPSHRYLVFQVFRI